MRRTVTVLVVACVASVLAACSGGDDAAPRTTTRPAPSPEVVAYCATYLRVIGTLEAPAGAAPPDEAFFADVATLRDDAPEEIAEPMRTATAFYDTAGRLLADGGTAEQLVEAGNADSEFMSASFPIGGWVDQNCSVGD
jgi:hypothetical protein